MNKNIPRFVSCEGIEVEADETAYATHFSQIQCEDVFYFGDQVSFFFFLFSFFFFLFSGIVLPVVLFIYLFIY